MSLAAQQKFQARFYTDPELRERSLADPESVAAEFGIDKELVKSMVEQGGHGMKVFTSALIRKRYKQATALLPVTAVALKYEFQRLFEEYAASHPIPDIHRYESDALAFAEDLIPRLEPDLQDFLRYECLLVRWQAHPPRLAWTRFRYPVAFMAIQIPKREPPFDHTAEEFSRKNTWVVTWRRGGEQRIFVWPKVRIPIISSLSEESTHIS